MSTSDLYILNKKSTTHFREFRNGWGSAPLAWDFIGEKYIPEKPVYSMDSEYLRRVWALAGDTRLEACERIVMMMTFDRAFVPRDRLKEAGEACQDFGRMSSRSAGYHDRVNHWHDIGSALIEMSNAKLTRHARGAALSCTSVSDMWGWPEDDQLSRAWPIFKAEAESPTEEPS